MQGEGGGIFICSFMHSEGLLAMGAADNLDEGCSCWRETILKHLRAQLLEEVNSDFEKKESG